MGALAILFGGIDTGWTFYTPYSSTYSNSFVAIALTGVFINGFSSILTGVNFVTTVHKMRAPGMTWFRQPEDPKGLAFVFLLRPGTSATNHFGLEQADNGLRHGIVVGVADAADRGGGGCDSLRLNGYPQ